MHFVPCERRKPNIRLCFKENKNNSIKKKFDAKRKLFTFTPFHHLDGIAKAKVNLHRETVEKNKASFLSLLMKDQQLLSPFFYIHNVKRVLQEKEKTIRIAFLFAGEFKRIN